MQIVQVEFYSYISMKNFVKTECILFKITFKINAVFAYPALL